MLENVQVNLEPFDWIIPGFYVIRAFGHRKFSLNHIRFKLDKIK